MSDGRSATANWCNRTHLPSCDDKNCDYPDHQEARIKQSVRPSPPPAPPPKKDTFSGIYPEPSPLPEGWELAVGGESVTDTKPKDIETLYRELIESAPYEMLIKILAKKKAEKDKELPSTPTEAPSEMDKYRSAGTYDETVGNYRFYDLLITKEMYKLRHLAYEVLENKVLKQPLEIKHALNEVKRVVRQIESFIKVSEDCERIIREHHKEKKDVTK